MEPAKNKSPPKLELKPHITKKKVFENNRKKNRMEFIPKKVSIGSPVTGNHYDKRFESISEAEQIKRSIK